MKIKEDSEHAWSVCDENSVYKEGKQKISGWLWVFFFFRRMTKLSYTHTHIYIIKFKHMFIQIKILEVESLIKCSPCFFFKNFLIYSTWRCNGLSFLIYIFIILIYPIICDHLMVAYTIFLETFFNTSAYPRFKCISPS